MAGDVTKEKIEEFDDKGKWKLTQDTVNKLEQAFSIDATVEEACFFANISKQTYYNWCKYNTELKDRFDALRNKPVLKARQEVIKGLDNNPEFSLKYLERKRKDEFSPRTEQVSVSDGDVNEALDSIQELIKAGQSNEQGSTQTNTEPVQGGAEALDNSTEVSPSI